MPNRPARCDTCRHLLPGVLPTGTVTDPAGTAAASGFGTPVGEASFDRVEQPAVAPIDVNRVRYLFDRGVAAKPASPAPLDAMYRVANAAFAEDKRMIGGRQAIWDRTPAERRRAFIPRDEAPAIFRRLLARRPAPETAHESEELAA